MTKKITLETLKQLREMRQLTQADVARYFGFKTSGRITINKWENGIEKPANKHRDKFISYLSEVLGLRDDPETFRAIWNFLSSSWDWQNLRFNEKQITPKFLEDRAEIHTQDDQSSSIFVIGHSLPGIPSTPWSGEEPNITDYHYCIIDFTTKERSLPPIGALSVTSKSGHDLSKYIFWMGIREQFERSLMANTSIIAIVNQDIIVHPDAPGSIVYDYKFQSVLPFIFYGRANPPGQVVYLVNPQFKFYFSELGSWDFVFSGEIGIEFECFERNDYELKVLPLAINRAKETLALHILVNNKRNNDTGNLYLLPRSTSLTSEENIRRLLHHIYLFQNTSNP